jgi:hypothetical protein
MAKAAGRVAAEAEMKTALAPIAAPKTGVITEAFRIAAIMAAAEAETNSAAVAGPMLSCCTAFGLNMSGKAGQRRVRTEAGLGFPAKRSIK